VGLLGEAPDQLRDVVPERLVAVVVAVERSRPCEATLGSP